MGRAAQTCRGRRAVSATLLALGVGALLALVGGAAADDLEPLETLPDRWLQAVAPWMTNGEQTAFAALGSARARELFAIEFWRVRGRLENDEGRLWLEEWRRRVDEASLRFGPRGGPPDLRGDRARALLVAGVPEDIVAFGGCRGQLRPMRIWRYDAVQAEALDLPADGARPDGAVRADLFLLFVRTSPGGDVLGASGDAFRQWSPDEGLRALSEKTALTAPRALDDLLDYARQHRCFRTGVREERALRRAIEGATSRGVVAAMAEGATDGWWTGEQSAAATELLEVGGPVSIEYAPIAGGRSVVATIRVALDLASLRAAPGGRIFDRLLLDGAVHAGTRGRSLPLDRFRRVFVVAGVPPATGRAELVVERQLRPGAAVLDLRLADARGLALLRQRLPLRVPADSAEERGDGSRPATRRAVSPQQALRLVTFPSVTLRPPRSAPVGVHELVAVTSGGPIARIDFELDGAPVGSVDRPPWRLAVEFGDEPRRRMVGVVARAPDGRVLARDERILEAEVRPFALRLERLGTVVEATLSSPPGTRVDEVVFSLDETVVARRAAPPYRLELPAEASGWVRAVARGADGATAEDFLFLGRLPASQRLDVRLIEVLASVVDDHGRPLADVQRREVRVAEDGVRMPIERFEPVADLPLRVALLLDTSESMRERLGSAVTATRRFLGTLVRDGDRVAWFDFDDDIRLRMPLTGAVDRLRLASSGLTTHGGTRLWDAVAAAGTYLAGVRERRALVLLSDGRDVGSDYRPEQLAELVERSGVAVYPILLDLRDASTRSALGRIAERSGGAAFDVASEGGLDAVFRRIEAELRSQYLLTYSAPSGERGDAYRTIELSVDRPGARVRAKRGYYP